MQRVRPAFPMCVRLLHFGSVELFIGDCSVAGDGDSCAAGIALLIGTEIAGLYRVGEINPLIAQA